MKWIVVAAALVGGAAMAQDSGTRVSIKAPKPVAVPEGEALVKALEAVGGGERQVQVQRRVSETEQTVQLDLWGAFTPAAEIADTLRSAFPALKDATIEVSTLDASQKPPPPAEPPVPGQRKVIKKKIIQKEVEKAE